LVVAHAMEYWGWEQGFVEEDFDLQAHVKEGYH
jgi:hypothetical protein